MSTVLYDLSTYFVAEQKYSTDESTSELDDLAKRVTKLEKVMFAMIHLSTSSQQYSNCHLGFQYHDGGWIQEVERRVDKEFGKEFGKEFDSDQ